ncbi:MAG TPA: YggT family protein [Thermoanaerobaculia bacterium]|nr:YggT family protein [Thermoanaerobaculia bacterium]
MNVGGSAFSAVIETALFILNAIQWLVIVAALISWVSPDPRNPIVRFLYGVTEPMFRPFRRLIPPSRTGGIDLSPIFVIVIIYLLSRFLARLAVSGAF